VEGVPGEKTERALLSQPHLQTHPHAYSLIYLKLDAAYRSTEDYVKVTILGWTSAVGDGACVENRRESVGESVGHTVRGLFFYFFFLPSLQPTPNPQPPTPNPLSSLSLLLTDGRTQAADPPPLPPDGSPRIIFRPNVSFFMRAEDVWVRVCVRRPPSTPPTPTLSTLIPPLPSPLSLIPPLLVGQDFPYNFEAGIEHHNVWASRALTPGELAEAVAAHRPPVAWEAAWFVNPAALASIPTIWHAHVLSRQRKDGE